MSAFEWMVGIENTYLGEWQVDQLAMTGHYERIEADLELAARSGASGIRFGLPWARLEPESGRYAWDESDRAMAAMNRLGLTPVWDLVHFGTPPWLSGGFSNPAYPERVAAYAAAFASRYPSVRRFTPFNEPYICAFFRGGNGTWPPHGLSSRAFVAQLVPILEGIRKTVAAIKALRPDAEIWLNDGADAFHAGLRGAGAARGIASAGADATLVDLAAELEAMRFLPLDVLLGKALPGTPSFEYLQAHGAERAWLSACARDPVAIDVIGLDYYPGSEHLILGPGAHRDPGDWGRRSDYRLFPDPRPQGLTSILRLYAQRYGKPLYLAETSSGSRQVEWLSYCLAELAAAIGSGVQLRGLCWWPLFDMVDWDSGLTRLAGTICSNGLWHGIPSARDRVPGEALPAFISAARSASPLAALDALNATDAEARRDSQSFPFTFKEARA